MEFEAPSNGPGAQLRRTALTDSAEAQAPDARMLPRIGSTERCGVSYSGLFGGGAGYQDTLGTRGRRRRRLHLGYRWPEVYGHSVGLKVVPGARAQINDDSDDPSDWMNPDEIPPEPR